MRISDWSSDVCSSDLPELVEGPPLLRDAEKRRTLFRQAQQERKWQAPPVGFRGYIRFAKLERRMPLCSSVPNESLSPALAKRDLQSATVSPFNAVPNRSEEPTSELQSLLRISYAVLCLKKKI